MFDTRAAPTGQPFIVGPGMPRPDERQCRGSQCSTPLQRRPLTGMFFHDETWTSRRARSRVARRCASGSARDTFRSAFAPPTGDSRAAQSGDLAGSKCAHPGRYHGHRWHHIHRHARRTVPAFSGTVANRIGAGYSFLDGFGFINAQSAVSQPIPSP